tara:strand:- start:219 stop:344 length:126 start_codon:yes stop_codon:yes gene_type:complete
MFTAESWHGTRTVGDGELVRLTLFFFEFYQFWPVFPFGKLI